MKRAFSPVLALLIICIACTALCDGAIRVVDNPPEAEPAQTVTLLFDLSADTAANALVLFPSVPIAKRALDMIRQWDRHDILLVTDVPQDKTAAYEGIAAAILPSDALTPGEELLEACAAYGITALYHCAYPRHLADEAVLARHEALQRNAEAHGCTFYDVSMPDPLAEAGVAGSLQFMLEYMTAQMAELSDTRMAFCMPYLP